MGHFLFYGFHHFVFFAPFDGEISIEAGDFHGRVVAQEGIPAPGLVVFRTFQDETVVAGSPQGAHHFYRRKAVSHDFPAYGNASVQSRTAQFFYFFQGWIHNGPPSLCREQKNPSRQKKLSVKDGYDSAVPPCFTKFVRLARY